MGESPQAICKGRKTEDPGSANTGQKSKKSDF
jgi:hypothetical protein